jgi:glutathionyl-hydroquinone reductase
MAYSRILQLHVLNLQIDETFSVSAAQRSYYSQLFPLNPSGIVPAGPRASDLGLGEDPNRGPLDIESVFFAYVESSEKVPK